MIKTVDLSKEDWLPIEGYEGWYWVSNMGRVMSFVRTIEGKLLKPAVVQRTHHHQVALVKNGKKTWHRVHALVLEAFVGPRPDGLVGCHNDDDTFNNCVHNLRWDTQKENYKDRAVNGKRTGKHKVKYLAPDDVTAIREALANGIQSKALAAEYGVHRSTICRIKNNYTHKD